MSLKVGKELQVDTVFKACLFKVQGFKVSLFVT